MGFLSPLEVTTIKCCSGLLDCPGGASSSRKQPQHRKGREGRKPRTGEQGSQDQGRLRVGDTPRTEKGRGWRRRRPKTSPRRAEQDPKEEKLRRGSGGSRLKQPWVATDSRAEQSPVGGGRDPGAGGNTGREHGPTGKRATAGDEPVRLRERENPWRANPGRGCGVKQTHEGRRRRKPSRA
jgi:hypothetical protein